MNVASDCHSPISHYQVLEDLYERFHDRGLEILAFPSYQLNKKEPTAEVDLKAHCNGHGVPFPMFQKVPIFLCIMDYGLKICV